MVTAYATHARYVEHDNPHRPHPEHAGRLRAIWDVLNAAQLPERMRALSPNPISEDAILKVHTPDYLRLLQLTSQQAQMSMIDADTYAMPQSYEIARLSAGGVLEAVEAVITGAANNALAAVRPPGHHATRRLPMGFCLLNNIALGARHAQMLGANKVLIVDFDVHHGNGTQDIFYDDPDVLFVSLHQHPFYPGTGALRETGRGPGQGTTLNIPLGPRHGDVSYAALFERVIWPRARRFAPDVILVSAGFDAHWNDPLAMMALSLTGFAHLTRELLGMARELCDDKIIFVLEGGYDLEAVAHGVRNVAHALLGEDTISDPYGPAPAEHHEVGALIADLQGVHQL